MARNKVPDDIRDLYENKAHVYRFQDDPPEDVGDDAEPADEYL